MLAHINAGDYSYPVFRAFPHGLSRFVPSLHSGPGRRLGRQLRFASERIDDIRGFSSAQPGRADCNRLRTGFRWRDPARSQPRKSIKKERTSRASYPQKTPKTLSTSPWIRFLVCESYEGLVAESRQSFFEDNMPFPQMLSAGIEN